MSRAQVTGSTANAIMSHLRSVHPQAQAAQLLKNALAEFPADITAKNVLVAPQPLTQAQTQAANTLSEFEKKYPNVLGEAASQLDKECDALKTQRAELVEKYDAQITRLTEAKTLIEQDIQKLVPPVVPQQETADAKKLREQRIESLKTVATSSAQTIADLTKWKDWADGKPITTGSLTNPGIQVPNNPAKTDKIEGKLATAEYKLEKLAPPHPIRSSILTEIDKAEIEKNFDFKLTGNPAADRFSTTFQELKEPLLKLKELEIKVNASPQASARYRDDYINTLKQISNINERIAQQLKDDNARQLIANAANQKLLSQRMRGLLDLQTQVEREIGAYSTSPRYSTYPGKILPDKKIGLTKEIVEKIDSGEDTISAEKLGKNYGFSWTEKVKDPMTGQLTGKTKEMSLKDDKGNQIHFSLGEMKEMVAKKNAEEFAAWQKAGKVGPAPEPITVTKNRFSDGYTIHCHDAERRADFINTVMKPTWDAKVKAKQTATQTATQTNVPAPVSVTEANGVPAPAPGNQRDSECTVKAIHAACDKNDFAEMKNLINAGNLNLQGCQQLLNTLAQPLPSMADGYKDAYKALQAATTNLQQQQDGQRNLRADAAQARLDATAV